jgi:hypothetical protein
VTPQSPPPRLRLPFKVEHKLPFKLLQEERQERRDNTPSDAIRARQQAWIDALKKQARDNINSEYESLRISWTNRYKRPKYDHFDEYTLEEVVLENWEQFYFENPDHLELKGISKKINERTKNTYYVTGDPVIDALEREFSEGRVPDLQAAFGHIKNGQDIFRSPVFKGRGGQEIVPVQRPEVVKKNEKGEKITEAGTRVEHDNYNSDEWLKEALAGDDVLRRMAEKMKKVTDAKL